MIKSRRERLREATIDEIKTTALSPISEGGKQALSMGAIARSMGMTTPALYRYFNSRDALLSSLIQDSYSGLNKHLHCNTNAVSREDWFGCLRCLFLEYRRWGLENRNIFDLMFGTESLPFRERVEHRQHLGELLQTLASPLKSAEAGGHWNPPEEHPSLRLFEEWKEWQALHLDQNNPSHSTRSLAVAFLLWTRCHGLLSYEINQVFPTSSLNFERLYEQELLQQSVVFGLKSNS